MKINQDLTTIALRAWNKSTPVIKPSPTDWARHILFWWESILQWVRAVSLSPCEEIHMKIHIIASIFYMKTMWNFRKFSVGSILRILFSLPHSDDWRNSKRTFYKFPSTTYTDPANTVYICFRISWRAHVLNLKSWTKLFSQTLTPITKCISLPKLNITAVLQPSSW